MSDRSKPSSGKTDFIAFAKIHAENYKNAGTKNLYLVTIEKITKFVDKDNLPFEQITLDFLEKFNRHLEVTGSGVNARSIQMRNIRTIFNRAIDKKIVGQEMYPFRSFKIRNEDKDKVSLSPEQVKKLYEYDFKMPSLRMARDFWMMSFLFCGINPIDLYHLKKPDVEGRISFVRTKEKGSNHITLRLLIQPETQEIINRYKGDDDSPYLLNFVDKNLSYKNFRSFLGKKIRGIKDIEDESGKRVLKEFEGLTMYHARYSWATIADGLDIQEKTISKGLGHVDKSLAGKKYIVYDWSKVDRANRQVIDFVLGKPKAEEKEVASRKND